MSKCANAKPTLDELRQQLQNKIAEMRELNAKALRGEELTEAEETRFDEAEEEAKAVRGLIEKETHRQSRSARLGDYEKFSEESQGRKSDPLPHEDKRNTRNGLHEYSLLKAVRQSDPRYARGQWVDGIEREVHDELAKRRHPMAEEARGVLVPWDLEYDQEDVRGYAKRSGEKRADWTTTTGAGGIQNMTEKTMIAYLRNKMLGTLLGVRILSRMNGNFSLPKQTGTGQAYWLTEGSDATEQAGTIGAVSYSPSTVSARTRWTRSFVNQTSIDAEAFARDDITRILAIELDRCSFFGSGSGAEPLGIAGNGSVNSVAVGPNGGAVTQDHLIDMESEIRVDNADLDTLAYVTSEKGRGKLKKTIKDSNTNAVKVWEDDELNDRRAFSSNQIPKNLTKGTSSGTCTAIILGAWSQAVWAMWGGLDVIVDPYSKLASGGMVIQAFQDADFNLLNPEAFCKLLDFVY